MNATEPEPLEKWREVWRDGLAPVLSTAGLEALRAALETDDARLIQGSTTFPPPLACIRDWPVEAACAVGFCAWKGDPLTRINEVEEAFCRSLSDADQRLGETFTVRHFLNWFDETPRAEVFAALLPEVVRELERRAAAPAA